MNLKFIKSISKIFLILLLIIFSNCTEKHDLFSPNSEEPAEESQLVDFSHSDECVGSIKKELPDVEIIVRGLYITVIHKNAIFNCCLDEIMVEFEQEHRVLKLFESEVVTMPCWCICPFEVKSIIQVSFPGRYIIEIWSYDHLIWSDSVEVS